MILNATEDTPLSIAQTDLLGVLEGQSATIVGLVDVNNGAITDNGDGSYWFTPAADKNGDMIFSYEVVEGGQSLSFQGVFRVEAVRDAVDLDCRLDNGSFRFDFVLDSGTFTGSATLDPEGLEVQTIVNPDHPVAVIGSGNASVNPNGSLAFTLGADLDLQVNYTVLIDGQPSDEAGVITYVFDPAFNNTAYTPSEFPACVPSVQ